MELTREGITEYLKTVSELETDLYVWREAMGEANETAKEVYNEKKSATKEYNTLHNEMENVDACYSRYESSLQYEHDKKESGLKNRVKNFKKIATIIRVAWVLFSVGFVFLLLLIGLLEEDFAMIVAGIVIACWFSVSLAIPVFIVSSIFAKKAKNAKAQLYCGSEIVPKQTWVQEKNQQYTKAKNNYERVKTKEAQVKERQALTFEGAKAVQEQLEKLYSVGILDERYHKLQAVHTLYDYFKTGRALVLYGPGGAIDMYEKALIDGETLDLLYDIRGLLTDMNRKQDFLYYEMQRANSKLQRIANNTYEMKEYQRETNEKLAHMDEFITRYR